MGDRKGRPYSQSPNTVRSTVRADVGIGPYGALLHLFVGRDAHAVERSGTSTLGVHRAAVQRCWFYRCAA